jgi:hypothetical protein
LQDELELLWTRDLKADRDLCRGSYRGYVLVLDSLAVVIVIAACGRSLEGRESAAASKLFLLGAGVKAAAWGFILETGENCLAWGLI